MGSLRFPAGVPAGPLQDLFLALHELHGLAGEPSVREMADAVGCSHHKVHQMFTQPRLPADGDTLWAVVEWLARQGRRPRIRAEDAEEEFWTWSRRNGEAQNAGYSLSRRASTSSARPKPVTPSQASTAAA